MKKGFILVLFLVALLLSFSLFSQTNETLTITTYYPAPYGSYNELQTNKLAVGDTNGDGQLSAADQPPANGQLYTARSVIYKPQSSLPAVNTRKGELIYDSITNNFKYYNGSKWKGLGGFSDVIVKQNSRILNDESGGVTVRCPPGYVRIACSGGLDWNPNTNSFWDSGGEEDKGYNGAAPVGTDGCTAFADGGVNVYVWAYCAKFE